MVLQIPGGSCRGCDVPSELNENLIPFDTYREYCNSFFTFYRRPCRQIEGPRVPGADNLATLDHAFCERPAVMGTFIVHRANDPVDIGDTQRPAAGGEFLCFARSRQLPLAADPY